jgi:decaprenyl-phosphate phosphoribosyltransferase
MKKNISVDSTETPTGNTSVLVGLIKLMRPKQWVKNAFVLAPLIFVGEFMNPDSVGKALLAMFLFSLASSTAYIINDLHDIEHDRKHPVKSKIRPLVSGLVTKSQALVLLGILYAGLVWGYFQQPSVILVILGYLVLNLAYTFILKHQPVIDIFTIAIGFVLRVYAGAVALSVPLSSWMFVTTLCLALYLAAIKRRQELVQSGTEGRKVLGHYTVSLMDRYAEIAATGAMLFYSLFVMTVRPEMVITIPFVLFGLFRYWFIVESLGDGESPTDVLLSDWQLLLTVVTWVGISAWSNWPAGG